MIRLVRGLPRTAGAETLRAMRPSHSSPRHDRDARRDRVRAGESRRPFGALHASAMLVAGFLIGACGGGSSDGNQRAVADSVATAVPASMAIQLASLTDSMAARRLVDSLTSEGWNVRVADTVVAERRHWRVRIVPPGNVGLPRLIAHALRAGGRETVVLDDSGSSVGAPVAVYAVNHGTHGMMARTRWAASPDGRTLLVVEDPVSIEADALPNGFVVASESGVVVQRDSVWDVSPSPDWRRIAYGRAHTRGAGERDSLSAAEWRELAASAGLDEAAVRASAFPTSGMAVAFGVARPAVIDLADISTDPRVEAARPDRLLARAGGWRVGWTPDGKLLAIGGAPALVQDDAPPTEWTLVDPDTGGERGSATPGSSPPWHGRPDPRSTSRRGWTREAPARSSPERRQWRAGTAGSASVRAAADWRASSAPESRSPSREGVS